MELRILNASNGYILKNGTETILFLDKEMLVKELLLVQLDLLKQSDVEVMGEIRPRVSRYGEIAETEVTREAYRTIPDFSWTGADVIASTNEVTEDSDRTRDYTYPEAEPIA